MASTHDPQRTLVVCLGAGLEARWAQRCGAREHHGLEGPGWRTDNPGHSQRLSGPGGRRRTSRQRTGGLGWSSEVTVGGRRPVCRGNRTLLKTDLHGGFAKMRPIFDPATPIGRVAGSRSLPQHPLLRPRTKTLHSTLYATLVRDDGTAPAVSPGIALFEEERGKLRVTYTSDEANSNGRVYSPPPD